ncbi:hypothetical protein LOTGIDRAFT_160461 [Lottia gigantea]|uniref:TNFR-Cys domain-containing protein n=1 Tax=Lottia gigantea TaxID=225164 RepID=V4AER0_LOTGI|nr:hypothetical protein LOTGIDRAFT_160461 [Lottia gigantea]ESO95332.1 hypothetical protein LOTGIDRAFT_160461 [Lottia gigantea]
MAALFKHNVLSRLHRDTTSINVLVSLMSLKALPTYRCSLCKPGYHALTNCTVDRDTVCTPCPEGSFKHKFNSDIECNQCSQCGVGLFVLNECSRTSDVFCESCASKTHIHLKTYLEFCLGVHDEVANMQADETFVNKDELKININTNKESQTDTSKHKTTSNQHPKGVDKTGSALLENLVVLPEDEAEKDNLLPVYTTKEPIETDESSLYEYKEISITDNFEGSGEGSGADVFMQTTPLVEELPSSGEGEIILKDNGENNDSIETVVVFGINSFRTFPPGEEEEDEEVIVVSPGAEKDSEQLHTAAVDNRTRAAIIIAVAVGSVVFFTVGFFVSRHYRRKRSLRISEKTPSQNHVHDSKDGIEFQDFSSKSKIYTAPEMSNKNGSYKKLDGGNIEDLYATTLKKDLRSRNGSDQDKHVNGIDKIKYIDDTEDEGNGASDRLLSTDQDNQDHSTSLSDVVLDKLEQRLSPIDEEKAPMLPK